MNRSAGAARSSSSDRRRASHVPSVLETVTASRPVETSDEASDADDTPLVNLIPASTTTTTTQSSRRKTQPRNVTKIAGAARNTTGSGEKPARGKAKSTGCVTSMDTSSEEEEFEDDLSSPKKRERRRITPPSASSNLTRNRRGTPVRSSAIQADHKLRESLASHAEEDTNNDSDSVPIISPKKKSKVKGARQKKKSLQLSSEDDSDIEILAKKKKSLPRKKPSIDSDEEFFLEEQDDDDESTNAASNESSEVTFEGDFDDDSLVEDTKTNGRKVDRNVTVGIVEDVGDQDDDDDSEVIPILKPSPALNDIQPRRHRASLMHDSSDDASSNVSSVDVLPLTSSSQKKRRSPKSSRFSKAHCVHCDSTRDVVTDEDLPDVHVCFFPPDNQNKQCFSLDTLRKIALAQPPPSLVSANGTIQRAKTSFLQPPHFRTPMSDDLLDQIASRFGRDALDIHGEYYRRAAAESRSTDGNWPEERTPGTSVLLAQSESIIHQLERYIRSRMGSQDVYCCPICYVAAHQRLVIAEAKGDEDDDDDDDSKCRLEENEYVTDFQFDPMAVLRDAGELADEFRVASTFCFKKVAQVKEHLRNDHSISTKMVQGNDLYVRYRIRSQDGLLQRFLNQNSGQYAPTRQGEMLKYWYHGNKSDFVLLLSLISHAALCRQIVKCGDATSRNEDRDAIEAAEEYLRPAWSFFESLSSEERVVWDIVASPFLKQSQDEIRDFIAEEDDASEGAEEGNDEPLSHRALLMQSEMKEFQRQQVADRKLAAHYVEMVQNLQSDNSLNDDDEEEANGDDDDELQDVNDDFQGQSSESEEADDEWQKKIMSIRLSKVKSQTPGKNSSRRRRVSMSTSKVSPQKRSVVELQGSSDSDEAEWPTSTPLAHKRLAIRDSDDEQ